MSRNLHRNALVINDGEFSTGLTLFPDGDGFFDKYAGQDVTNKLLVETTGMNTSTYNACQAAEDVIEMTKHDIKEVVMIYQDLPLSVGNIPSSIGSTSRALGTALGMPMQNVQSIRGLWDSFCLKCEAYGIIFHGAPLAGHSLGVPSNDDLRHSPEAARHAETNSLGVMVNFGGPTQPTNALNYTATNDLVSLPGAMAALRDGRACILVNSLNDSPLRAHSFLGPAYRAAMYDAIHNKGILRHE